jgi:phosphatidylglycerol:prolipoprotein diacylglycerol transferase
MCSELLLIPYEWGGVPIFGYGALLVLWAIVGVGGLARSVWRNGWTAEASSLVPLLLLTGAAIIGLPRLFPNGLPIRGYGLMVLIGAVAGVALAKYRARQLGLDQDLILSLALWLFIGGVIGARLFYVVEYWQERIRGDTWLQTLGRALDFPEGGLVIYGGLFGAAAAAAIFLRRERLPVLATADLIAPSLAIGLAFGRIGCLMNGCCYGGLSTLPWAVTFPPTSPPYNDQVATGAAYGFSLGADESGRPVILHLEDGSAAAVAGLAVGDVIGRVNNSSVASLAEAENLLFQVSYSREMLALELLPEKLIELPPPSPPARSQPVHPTQIYSAINAGLLAWFLWVAYPLRRRDGEIFALMLTIYPISRFMLEIIRTDERAVFGTGLSISQNISLAMFVAVIGLWAYLSRQPRGVVWATESSS